MPVPSMSLHVIKMHMAFQFICLATLIYTFEFIFLFPLGTVANTVQLKGEEGVFFPAGCSGCSTNVVGLCWMQSRL